MKITQKKVDSLIPYVKNSRTHSDAQVAQIAASIKEFGWTNPILVDGDNGIIAGHGRLMAARKLGYKEVPTIELADLTETQKRAYIIADNRLALNAGWDNEMLTIELNNLLADGFALELLGFDPKELNALLEPEVVEGLTDEDAVPDVPDEPTTKLGDIYQLGNHRLMCGDSTSIDAVDKLMDGQKADMVFTDPPYGMNLDTDYSKIKGSKKSIGFKGNKLGNTYTAVIGDDKPFDPSFLMEYFKDAKEQFWWGADYYIDKLPYFGMKGTLQVWNKRSSDAQQEGIGNCFELCFSMVKHKKYVFDFEWFGFLSKNDPKEARNRVHPTMKPTKLIERFFDKWGDGIKVVADVFGGSGSTLIACEKTGRQARLMELDPKYCDVIVKRWEDFTGKTAVLLSENVQPA
jgi:DNA modification methylase